MSPAPSRDAWASSPVVHASDPTGSGEAERDRAILSEPAPRKRFSITVNPLALAVGRFGMNAEWLVVRHHAVTASGFLQTFPRTLLRAATGDRLDGLDVAAPSPRIGAELGYRFYTGTDGPTGLFAGPSLVFMPIVYPRITADAGGASGELVPLWARGVALDVGVQATVFGGMTIGGGIGGMVLAYDAPTSTSANGLPAATFPEPHVLPRILLATGWSF